MVRPSSSVELLECHSCGNLGFGTGEISCCDRAMEPAEATSTAVNQPSLADVMRMVHGMSPTELDICLCVMEGGALTVSELAEQIDYDRSVVSRHLNHLVDLGVIGKQRRLLEGGGQVYIYTPNDPDVVRRQLVGSFMNWVKEATSLVDAVSRDKVEAIVDADTDDPKWKLYRT